MNNMRDVVDALHKAQVFYLATVDGDGKPHVRPFGAVVRYDNRVWFCTGNQKPVYKQIKDNGSVEISATLMDKGAPEILRISGKAVIEDNQGAKDAMFEAMPQLKQMYAEKMEQFAVFYLDAGAAKIYAMTGEETETLQV